MLMIMIEHCATRRQHCDVNDHVADGQVTYGCCHLK